MTNQEILSQFEALIDDSLDQDLEIQLANNAKNKLETELSLKCTQALDTSISTSGGGAAPVDATLKLKSGTLQIKSGTLQIK